MLFQFSGQYFFRIRILRNDPGSNVFSDPHKSEPYVRPNVGCLKQCVCH